MNNSRIPVSLRKKLVALSLAIAMGLGGAGVAYTPGRGAPSEAVLLAMELGAHYESSGRHFGVPYVDRVGKGQPLTVCHGITGKDVIAGKHYSPEDCRRLELPRYLEAERQAMAALKHWHTYNPYVHASFIDMVFNVGPGVLDGTTVVRLANAGDLTGACAQMTRWVYGRVDGRSVKMPGLVDRRGTTSEMCGEWGRDGKFGEAKLS